MKERSKETEMGCGCAVPLLVCFVAWLFDTPDAFYLGLFIGWVLF